MTTYGPAYTAARDAYHEAVRVLEQQCRSALARAVRAEWPDATTVRLHGEWDVDGLSLHVVSVLDAGLNCLAAEGDDDLDEFDIEHESLLAYLKDLDADEYTGTSDLDLLNEAV